MFLSLSQAATHPLMPGKSFMQALTTRTGKFSAGQTIHKQSSPLLATSHAPANCGWLQRGMGNLSRLASAATGVCDLFFNHFGLSGCSGQTGGRNPADTSLLAPVFLRSGFRQKPVSSIVKDLRRIVPVGHGFRVSG